MIPTHTRDIPARFDVAFREACDEIGCKPLDLLGVAHSESGCMAHATNGAPHHAVGLIQFMPETLDWLGFRRDLPRADRAAAFRHIDAVGQLPYVVRYFEAFRKQGAPWSSAGRLYQATFLPGTLATVRDDADVLVERGGRLGWAFEANAVFDENGDGRIALGELTAAIYRNARGARYMELLERLGLAGEHGVDLDPDGDGFVEIASCIHLQTALVRLGFEPGPLDGLIGPRTRAAVAAFQNERGMPVTGIPDIATRRAVALAVETSC